MDEIDDEVIHVLSSEELVVDYYMDDGWLVVEVDVRSLKALDDRALIEPVARLTKALDTVNLLDYDLDVRVVNIE